jgi:prefoldin subunit 5
LHFHDHFIRERKPTELTKETREALEVAEGKEGSLKKAEELARKRLDEIEKGMNKTQSEIRDLVDQYNSLSLSRNFAGHIQSTIKILEHRKEELQSRPNTKNEVDILDGAIKKLREKLRIFSEESTGSRRGLWDSIRGVWRSS